MVADGVRLRVRVQPRARRNRIDGLVAEADGGVAVKLAVTATPADGKANAAVVALLAEAWGIAGSTVSVAAGAADRRKIVHVAGDPAQLQQRLAEWLAGLQGA